MNDNMNYYEILDINQSAIEEEIKKAYFLKIRQYSNETHPDEFKLITKAYKTLNNQESRMQYDQSLQQDDQYDMLMRDVQASINNQDYYQALKLVNNLLHTYPENPDALYQKAYIQMQLNQISEAKNILNGLILRFPENKDYLGLTALLYFKSEDYYKSIELLNKLIELAPKESDYYLRLSTAFYKLNDPKKSLEVLEKRLLISENVQEFPLLLEMFYITLMQNDRHYKHQILNRIKQLPKNDDENRLMIDWIINECTEITPNHMGFPDLVELVKQLNQNYDDVNEWLHQVGNVKPAYNQTASTAQTYHDVSAKGSVGMSIVIGILGAFLHPILGIILGFVYYFNAGKIKAAFSGANSERNIHVHSNSFSYASFGGRAFALIIDGLLISIGAGILGAMLGLSDDGFSALAFIAMLIYKAGMESSASQATFGKKIMKIKVTNLSGNRISFARGIGRFFGSYLSSIILGIGYLFPFFNQKKQTLHDMLAKTVVVRR